VIPLPIDGLLPEIVAQPRRRSSVAIEAPPGRGRPRACRRLAAAGKRTGAGAGAAALPDFFGVVETPRFGKTPVVVHLLAPNRRPVQATSDLRGF